MATQDGNHTLAHSVTFSDYHLRKDVLVAFLRWRFQDDNINVEKPVGASHFNSWLPRGLERMQITMLLKNYETGLLLILNKCRQSSAKTWFAFSFIRRALTAEAFLFGGH
ncbi:uncharacterized protein F4822DRAFT_400579 [Hypoxylon trugodes]|uniref:uncharacterized protein n=1 Tax=Hypoxylon trugodes TaxID=326681 RepID=UPI00219FD96E|nr:uncharacterized protein F4822DRAFT_400579 [Hypoxylon trugodes]KAI1390034.1 hypothetical protein F4822DRAFT_400579 [Hypoxylon trugodes]